MCVSLTFPRCIGLQLHKCALDAIMKIDSVLKRFPDLQIRSFQAFNTKLLPKRIHLRWKHTFSWLAFTSQSIARYRISRVRTALGVGTREQRMRRAPATTAVFSAGSRLDRIKP